ncbi:hypothetical protein GCM10028809_43280 [Spirosoma gilvum]
MIQAYLLSDINSLTTTADHILLVEPGREGLFSYASGSTASADSALVLVPSNGRRYLRVVEGLGLNVKWFGAKGDSTTDDTRAIQAAINAVCSQIGSSTQKPTRSVLLPAGTYRVTQIVDLSNTRQTSTLSRDGITILGEGITRTKILGRTGSGHAIMDVSGSQWLNLSDLTLQADGATGSSTIGIYSGVFSGGNQQTQNQQFNRIAIFMHNDTSANAHNGTVAYYNFGSEENTHHAIYYRANRPVVLTASNMSPLTYGYAKSTLLTNHSLGVTTFSGECFLESLGSMFPAIETQDVNSIHADNLYISGSSISGLTPTTFQAIRVRGGLSNSSLRGTIEGFSGMAQVYGRIEESQLSFQFGNTNVTGKAVVQLESGANEGRISQSDIKANMSQDTIRPFWYAPITNTLDPITQYVSDTEITTNRALAQAMLPEKVAFNPMTQNVRIRSHNKPEYIYQAGQQSTNIVKTMIKGFGSGGITTKTIATITMPTVITANSGMSILVHIEGSAGHNIYVSDAVTTLFWEGTLPIVSSKDGDIYVGTASTSAKATYALISVANDLSNIGLTGVISGNTVQINLTPTVSGSSNDGVYFVGKITLQWMGHRSNAPSMSF